MEIVVKNRYLGNFIFIISSIHNLIVLSFFKYMISTVELWEKKLKATIVILLLKTNILFTICRRDKSLTFINS